MATDLKTTARKILEDLKQKYPSLSPSLLDQLVRVLESEKRFQTEFTKFFQDVDKSDLEAKAKLQKWVREHAPHIAHATDNVDFSKAPIGDRRLAVVADEFHLADFQHADFVARFKEHHAVILATLQTLGIKDVESFKEALREGHVNQHADPAQLLEPQQHQVVLYKAMEKVAQPEHVQRMMNAPASPRHDKDRADTKLLELMVQSLGLDQTGRYALSLVFASMRGLQANPSLVLKEPHQATQSNHLHMGHEN